MGPAATASRHSPLATRHSLLRIGSRASKLALTQAEAVAQALVRAHPGLAYEIVHITTAGDRRRVEALPAIGGKGLFTKELEEALLAGRIDLAVHSLKDLPTDLPPGLALLAVPERVAANDAFISADGRSLADLRHGARVGTSSLRRAAQLRRLRPDLRLENIRGNVDTRLRKLREGQYDAIVLAFAGLTRLGLADQVTEVLPFDVMLPAPGQGALALEGRSASPPPSGEGRGVERHAGAPTLPSPDGGGHGVDIPSLVAAINDPLAFAATTAERALLQALGGGCSLPLGAYAEVTGPDTLRLRAILLSPDGTRAAQADRSGPLSDPAALARAVAADLRSRGADALLDLPSPLGGG